MDEATEGTRPRYRLLLTDEEQSSEVETWRFDADGPWPTAEDVGDAVLAHEKSQYAFGSPVEHRFQVRATDEKGLDGLDAQPLVDFVSAWCEEVLDRSLEVAVLLEAQALNRALSRWDAWDRDGSDHVASALQFAGLALRKGDQQDRAEAKHGLACALDRASEVCFA